MACSVLSPTTKELNDARDREDHVTRAQLRLERKRYRLSAREDARGRFFSRRENGITVYHCCRRRCAFDYACSKEHYDRRRSQAKLFTVLRQHFHNMTRVELRQAILPRFMPKNARRGVKTQQLFLDRLDVIRDSLQQNSFPIFPLPNSLRRVCRRFLLGFGREQQQIRSAHDQNIRGGRLLSGNDWSAGALMVRLGRQ